MNVTQILPESIRLKMDALVSLLSSADKYQFVVGIWTVVALIGAGQFLLAGKECKYFLSLTFRKWAQKVTGAAKAGTLLPNHY
jgi:hypothetical protein